MPPPRLPFPAKEPGNAIHFTQDYFPFGSLLPDRGYDAGEYRYGFNGKENDNEVYGEANFQDYGMRYYDPRVARFVSVDPLTKDYPWYTPYQFAGNKPIIAIDIDGAEENIAIWNRGENKKMSMQAYVKWSTLFPGQEHGPLGAGTLTVIRKEIGNAKGCYSSELQVMYSQLSNENKVEVYQAYRNTAQGKSNTVMQVLNEWDANLEGGADGDPGYNSNALNGSYQIEGTFIAGYGGSVSLGYAWDEKGNRAFQFTINQGVGWDMGVSVEIQEYTATNQKRMDVDNLSGESESLGASYFAGYTRSQSIGAFGEKGKTYTANSATFSFPFSFGASYKRGYTFQAKVEDTSTDVKE